MIPGTWYEIPGTVQYTTAVKNLLFWPRLAAYGDDNVEHRLSQEAV